MRRFLLLSLFLGGCLGPGPRRLNPPPSPATAALPAPLPPPPAPPAAAEILSPDGRQLQLVQGPISFEDDGGLKDLRPAVLQSLDYYKSLPPGTSFVVGPERVTAARMAGGLQKFLDLMELPPRDFRREAAKLFKLYRSPGVGGVVTLSSYYEHTLDAALARGGEYQFPLYGKPDDLVETDSPRGLTVGRRENGALVPYYTRAEIDGGGALEGRNLEIAWAADPLDIFFLQVQGSGWLRLPGEAQPLRVRFAAHNGRPYQSVGGYMVQKGLLDKESGSAREKVVNYMREHPEERQELLNRNPRYVFFQIDRGPGAAFALGSLRRPLTPRRSVAADRSIFPPGALAWMESERPRGARFVLCQDEGGAIRGPGRVDYFVGAGKAAEEDAIRFWTPGRFTVLVPRE